MVESMEITSVLPDDVLEEILVRLPVKHLLSLKCVCKDWYALIGESRFHTKHYHLQYAKHLAEHNDIPLFLDNPNKDSHPDLDPDPELFYLLSKRQGVDSVLNVTPDFDIPPAFANDPKLRKSEIKCLGVVNGVVCLEWGTKVYPCERKGLALWNPATRQFKGIPHWPVLLDNERTRSINTKVVGLGFDLLSNDFKILGLLYNTYNYCGHKVSEFHLYSLKADSWKRIMETPSSLAYLCFSDADTYLNNGVTYWIAKYIGCHHYRILSLNFSTETFKESELPEGRSGCDRDQHMIGKYKEGLGLYITSTLDIINFSVEIWAVSKFSDDDNEVPLTWQRVCTIGPIDSFNGLYTLTIRVCGDLLLIINNGGEEEGCIYDPSTDTYNLLGVLFYSSFSYVESLFCLSGRIN